MAITPVHSSTDAVAQAVQQPKNNTQTQHSQANSAATAANNVHHSQSQAVASQQKAALQSVAQAPKPVVNSQGQTTGKIINATA